MNIKTEIRTISDAAFFTDEDVLTLKIIFSKKGKSNLYYEYFISDLIPYKIDDIVEQVKVLKSDIIIRANVDCISNILDKQAVIIYDDETGEVLEWFKLDNDYDIEE